MAVRDSLFACCHNVSLSGGARSLLFLGGTALGLDVTLTKEFNRYLEPWVDRWNLNLVGSVRRRGTTKRDRAGRGGDRPAARDR